MQRYKISILDETSTYHLARVALTFVPRVGDTMVLRLGSQPTKAQELLVSKVMITPSEYDDEYVQIFVTYVN